MLLIFFITETHWYHYSLPFYWWEDRKKEERRGVGGGEVRDRMRIICLGAKSCRLTQDPFLIKYDIRPSFKTWSLEWLTLHKSINNSLFWLLFRAFAIIWLVGSDDPEHLLCKTVSKCHIWLKQLYEILLYYFLIGKVTLSLNNLPQISTVDEI